LGPHANSTSENPEAHPTQHPFNSPRRDVHEKFKPTRCDPPFSLQHALDSPCDFRAQQRPPIIEQIAKTYGVDSWDQVQAIRYTWNVDIPGLLKASHKWSGTQDRQNHLRSTDKDGKPVKVTYDSSQLSSQSDQVKNEVEPAFVNDNYWLLFPFHAYWDTSANVTIKV